MPDALDVIASAVTKADDRGAVLRIGVVTAVEAGGTGRVKLNTTGDVFLNSDADSVLQVGDKCYAIMMGPTGVVIGKLGPDRGLPVGSITMYAGTSSMLPTGWLICQGQAVSRTTYAELFSRLGTSYGVGDGSTTFNLPDLNARFPLGLATGAARSRGDVGGAESVTLTTAQIPAHTHGAAGAHTHSLSTAGSNILSSSTATRNQPDATTGTTGSSGSHTHASVGGGDAHENMPPYVVVYYLIKVV